MALLFAENGIHVSLNDPSEDAVNGLLEQGNKEGFGDRLEKRLDYQDLCKNLGSPKIFFFSLPHGTVGDTVVDGLQQYLDNGDIIVDASNEYWQNTQRRQGKLVPQGVYYVGEWSKAKERKANLTRARHGRFWRLPGGKKRAIHVSWWTGRGTEHTITTAPEGRGERWQRQAVCRQSWNRSIRTLREDDS